MVHVEDIDVVHVLVREMLTPLEMFRISVPVMHEYQRDEPLDHTAENLAGRMTTVTLVHNREQDEETFDGPGAF